eukprot:gnl/TRDRNA2_/TRDRNA2_69515_c0_seq1.p1 gnl/TRDRNA2_/TRDRNA2_69515_c0~~gnl/TRDRNA2_/TRDRNA2_69515_c0_seq1.p1  ORF type:complete len:242 (+),score=15.96 gnl/TRDRNA2_/TRDRNA2_69515_c0_seq1:146-871(+)
MWQATTLRRTFLQRCRRLHCGRLSQCAEGKDLASVSQHVKYTGLWGAIVTFPKRQPFVTHIILATAGSTYADYVVQYQSGQELDLRRLACFCAFGGFYQGTMSWLVYISLFRRLFPHAIVFSNRTWAGKLADRKGQLDVLKQTCFDNFAYVPFVFFPSFYVFKQVVQETEGSMRSAFDMYFKNFVTDNLSSCCFWVPMGLLVFSVPAYTRMPVNHLLTFGWFSFLSWLRGAELQKHDAVAA